jgi:hypothetical protein
MRRRGLPAVRPLAYAAKRTLGFVKAGILITEAAPNTVQLDTWASEHVLPGGLTNALGRQIRRLHDAGVRHGGLYLRNVLLDTESAGDWRFFLIDPGRSGRFLTGPLPRAHVLGDLSDLAASAMVVARATDRMRFAHAYFGTQRLRRDHRQLLADVLVCAKRKLRQEGHRIAIGGVIYWLQARVERCDDVAKAPFEGVGDFVTAADGASISWDGPLARHASVTLSVRDAASTLRSFRLSFVEGRVSAKPSNDETGDLVIRADEETWLAMLNAAPNAFDLVRRGRVTMVGDTRQLKLLTRLVDGLVATEAQPGRSAASAECRKLDHC